MYNVVQTPAKKEDINLTVEAKQDRVEEVMKKDRMQMWSADEPTYNRLRFLANRQRVMDDSRPVVRDGELRYKQFISLLYSRRDGLANVNKPIEFATIENKMADELSQKPLVTLIPQAKDDVYKVSVMKHVWDYVWVESDTEQELFEHFLCKNIFGTSFWFEGLHRETFTRYEPIREGNDGKIGMKPITETRTYLKGYALDIRDVWIDPVYSIDVAEDCFIRQTDMSYDELLQLANDPNYNKDAILSFLSTRQGDGETGTGTVHTTNPFYTYEESLATDNTKFSLMHYYNKRLGLYIVTDEDFKFEFRYGANPYPHGQLPISALQDHKNYRSIYGRGECELLESTKYERNMIWNQFLDSVRFSNTINLAVGEDLTFQDSELQGGNARVWNFRGDLNQFQFLKPPQQDSGLMKADEMLANEATWITGIDNNSLAGSPEKTAFQARLQEQQKLKRIFMSLRLADFFYTRMGRQRLANIQFFLPYTTGKVLTGDSSKFRTIPIQDVESEDVMGVKPNGEVIKKGIKFKSKAGSTEFLELTPKQLKNNMDIIVTTPSTTPILRDLNRAEMQELLNMLISLAQFPTGQKMLEKFNADEYFADAAENLGFDSEKYFGSQEDMSDEDIAEQNQELMGELPMPPQMDSPMMNTPPPNPGISPSGQPMQPAAPVQAAQPIPAGM